MIDDALYRRQMLHFLRMHLELTTTVTAMGEVLRKTVSEDFERAVGTERAALSPKSKQIIDAFEAADTAEWAAMLRRLSGPTH